jgi:hypothetical protein
MVWFLKKITSKQILEGDKETGLQIPGGTKFQEEGTVP